MLWGSVLARTFNSDTTSVDGFKDGVRCYFKGTGPDGQKLWVEARYLSPVFSVGTHMHRVLRERRRRAADGGSTGIGYVLVEASPAGKIHRLVVQRSLLACVLLPS